MEIMMNTALIDSVKELQSTMGEIMKQQENITKMLINTNGLMIQYVNSPTYELMIDAVKQNGMAIKYIPSNLQTKELKELAIESNPNSIEFIYKPTYEMWINAVGLEYFDDEPHPIRFVKDLDDGGDPDRIATVYCSFIDANPTCFRVIEHDISGLPAEDAIWAYVAKEYPNSGYFRRCPLKIKERIIDCIMETQPQLLDECEESLWSGNRTLLYLSSNPCHIPRIIENRPDIDPIDWYKIALDRVDNRADVLSIMFTYPSELKTLENAKILLNTSSKYRIMNYICGFNIIDIEGVPEYILDTFPMNDLVEHVQMSRIHEMISKLSVFKRLKYLKRVKKCIGGKYGEKYISDVIREEEKKHE